MLAWTASFSRKAARRAKAAGDWKRAAQHYQRAIERDPRSAGTWVQYGNALRECGRTAEAETAYHRSLDLADDDPDVHVQLAHLFKQQRHGDKAIAEYLRALELDPWLLHASHELIELGWTNHVKPPSSRPRRPFLPGIRRESTTTQTLVVDISDLLLHFRYSRLPTGIQRVQLRIAAGLLDRQQKFEIALACFAPWRDFWVSVPADLFVKLADLATSGSATEDRPWQKAVSELTSILVHDALIQFPPGSVLVDLGASWPHLNYFLKVRNAKARQGIRFIPFVHDCVPALKPELCVEATVRSYIDWLLGALWHADGYLASSNSTAGDLSKFAEILGHRIPPPQVVPLDGRFSMSTQSACPARWTGATEPFVLLVSTFEPRKNHILAFSVWLKLIEKRGLRATPRLVCVGHRGWNAEAAMSLLRSKTPLKRRVRILTSITDADLAVLYQRCLFTFYPSVYEGWGLPITESLCYGKVPLIANASSMPEAGGGFAEYFNQGASEDLLNKLELLIDDEDYRARREASIRDKFRLRSWGAIADQVVDYAMTRQQGFYEGRTGSLPLAEIGRYYAIARSRHTSIEAGMIACERFRIGEGWWAPEEWGCWLKNADADLRFSLPQSGNSHCFLYIGLRGLPTCPVNFKLSVGADVVVSSGMLEADQRDWPMLRMDPDVNGGVVELRIASDQTCNLAEISGGLDRRVVTLGVIGLYVGADASWSPEVTLEGDSAVAARNPASAVAVRRRGSAQPQVPDYRLPPSPNQAAAEPFG